MLQFSEEFNCQIKWIYLGSGHGKSVPDGIGAVVKCVIQIFIAYNPSLLIYTVKYLMIVGLQSHLPSVELYQYSIEVPSFNNKIPSLVAVQGTAKLHEFLTKKTGEEVHLFVKNLSNEESRKVIFNLLQTRNDHTAESE